MPAVFFSPAAISTWYVANPVAVGAILKEKLPVASVMNSPRDLPFCLTVNLTPATFGSTWPVTAYVAAAFTEAGSESETLGTTEIIFSAVLPSDLSQLPSETNLI